MFVTHVYTNYGIYQTFGSTGAMLLIAMVWMQIVSKRFITPTVPHDKVTNVNGKEAAENRDLQIPLVNKTSLAAANRDLEIPLVRVTSGISAKEIEMQVLNSSPQEYNGKT